MNYFAHGRPFLDQPFVLAGTAIPDWLNVVDRQVRVRSAMAQPFVDASDARLGQIARGIIQHHKDDKWFHETRAFAELSWMFTAAIRDVLPADHGFRPSFLGHILVELLLDAVLIEENPPQLAAYYRVMDNLDAEFIGWAVNQMAPRPTSFLTGFIPRFSAERFLYDYGEDAKLLLRLNNVMKRVKLSVLPEQLCDLFPTARQQVRCRRDELLKTQ